MVIGMKCRNIHPIAGNEKICEDNIDIFSRLIKERIIFLSEEIDAAVATYITANLLFLDIQSKNEITLYINSIGGSVPDGLLTIYDTLQFIKSPVKTICIGEAYSSAAVILAAGTKGRRLAYPNAKIMIHNIQVEEMSGTQKEIQEESKRVKELNQVLMNIIANHTGQNIKKVRRDCLKDKYFNPNEAIKYGLIDSIVTSSKEVL
jgi:ATP-dependent Clp protease protease subunit